MLGLDANLGYEERPPSAHLAYCALARRIAAADAILRSESLVSSRLSILKEEIDAAMKVIQQYETAFLVIHD